MSKLQSRKHVLKEIMSGNFELPQGQQKIVRVVGSRGNNLHEVETAEPESQRFLVSMPCKFRRNIWAQRNKFVLVEPRRIAKGHKVKEEICKILMPEHIVEFKKAGVWPFTEKCAVTIAHKRLNYDDDDDDADDTEDAKGFLVRNLNRPPIIRFNEGTDKNDYDDDDCANNDDDDPNNDDDDGRSDDRNSGSDGH